MRIFRVLYLKKTDKLIVLSPFWPFNPVPLTKPLQSISLSILIKVPLEVSVILMVLPRMTSEDSLLLTQTVCDIPYVTWYVTYFSLKFWKTQDFTLVIIFVILPQKWQFRLENQNFEISEKLNQRINAAVYVLIFYSDLSLWSTEIPPAP